MIRSLTAILLLSMAALLIPASGLADVIWRGDFETGTTAQWRGAPKSDSIKVVDDPVREGKYALRIDGTNAARKGKLDRIEFQHQPEPPGTAEGTERYFGWSVFVPKKLTDDFHSVGYFETRNSWRQLMSFEVHGEDILYTTRVPYARRWTGKGKLTPGRWHDFAVHVLWSRDPAKGFVEVWFDGEQVVPRAMTATLLDENVAFFQIGLMRDTIEVAETIVIDHVIEATTLAEVTPPRLAENRKPDDAAVLPNPAAAKEPVAEARHFAEQIKPQFAKHCVSCHSGEKPKGNFAVDTLSLDFADKGNRQQWLAVSKQIQEGTMPPKGKPRPSAEESQALVDWISKRAAAESASQGRVVLRRLNRAEYANTVRDLLGVSVDLEDLLPLDTSTSGFDNSAESLHVSSYLMETYLEAADRVLDAAIVNGPRPWIINKRFDIKDEKSVKPKGSVYRHEDDGVAIFSSWVSANIQVTLWNFRTRFRGKYRFRISAHGIQTDKPVNFHVTAGTLTAVTEERILDYYSVPADKPAVIEFIEQLEPNNCIRIVADGLGALPPEVEKVGAENYKGPGLVVQWVDIEGPLLDTWPPASHRLIFGDMKQEAAALPDKLDRREVVSSQPLVDAERILREFTRRAFRRTVTDDDIKPFLARVRAKLDQEYSFEQAMRVGLKSVLVSPHFLFLREKDSRLSLRERASFRGAKGDIWSLDDFAIASRLSYFLWSSMPDEELLQLAEKGKLRQTETLREQVERMLKDPKSKAFTDNFAGQWLSLRAIDSTMPERMLYPEYDDILKVSMVKETLLFFDEVLKNDLSLTNFVASDFSMLNGRLAKHYGIPGVDGLDFRKVPLPPDSHRGGVMTMAAVLKVTANGTTTSPILRGAWVLDRILGTPPPKPTVDVEAIEPDIRGATTIRHQLAKHRQIAECASCHTKIDPPGFALENFDVIGGWRDHYRKINEGEPVTINGRRVRYLNGPPVDAADVLPDGRRFQNIDEYKQLLLNDKDQLVRALTEKLLAYGTGAAPTAADQAEIEAIVSKSREKNYGFRSLVHDVVQSVVFQKK